MLLAGIFETTKCSTQAFTANIAPGKGARVRFSSNLVDVLHATVVLECHKAIFAPTGARVVVILSHGYRIAVDRLYPTDMPNAASTVNPRGEEHD